MYVILECSNLEAKNVTHLKVRLKKRDRRSNFDL